MIGKNCQVIVYLQVAGLFLHRVCSASTGEKVIAQLQVLFLFTPSLVHSTKCKALVFPTTTISSVVVCTVVMLTSAMRTVRVHSKAEKCFSQCAVAASSLNFKLSSVLGARLLTFSLQVSGLILLLALKLA